MKTPDVILVILQICVLQWLLHFTLRFALLMDGAVETSFDLLTGQIILRDPVVSFNATSTLL